MKTSIKRNGLVLVQMMIALVLIIIALLLLLNLNGVAVSRRESARDTCRLIRGLALAGTSHSVKARRSVNAFIDNTPLHNCISYSERLVK